MSFLSRFKRAGGLARASLRCIPRRYALLVVSEEARGFEALPQRVAFGCECLLVTPPPLIATLGENFARLRQPRGRC